MQKRSELIRERLFECIHNGELETSDLVQIIEHLSIILNLKTLSQYAKDEQISYNGAKKRQTDCVTIAGEKLIVNAE